MRTRNWKKYNRQLIQRGSITFLIDSKLLKRPKRTKKNGRPLEFSNQLITMLMMVKIHYRLSYRTLEGFVKSLSALQTHTSLLPGYSLICKRAGALRDSLPKLSTRRPSVVILDASGVKIYGEGEWKVKIHGKSKPRKWIKIHIAIDAKTQEIVAEETTECFVKDGEMTESLLNGTRGSLKAVLADGAYDGRQSRQAIKKRRAQALIPPPRNARLRGRDENRDSAIRIITGLDGGKKARSVWGKLTGYSKRALVETAFSRMKRLYGDRLFSKKTEKQRVENRLRCVILNKSRRVAA